MISSTAIFACSDIEATLAHYKNVLGFESSWTWGEPPTFGSASRGGVTIMFSLQPALAANMTGHQHWINVEEIDELYRLHTSRNAKLVSEIEDKPWGFREYVVEDLNGYHLRFAGHPLGAAQESKSFPEGVTIERRKPTIDEYLTVESYGSEEAMAGILELTWMGIVALAPDGAAIGIVRIMRDAPGWFSIWDVAVLPEWQAQRIGSAMMKEALAVIREAASGAHVHLFTTKHGFYERLGFGQQTVSMRCV